MSDKTSRQGEKSSGENPSFQGLRAEKNKAANTERASKAELYSRHDKVAEKNVKDDPRES
ncbi:hypothetical protein ACQKO7_12690 [Pseudomonas putida]|uniref:hypothetical protein n=1 Tax=Pseudomonas putida TaxID=303 RepID=UPI003D001D58